MHDPHTLAFSIKSPFKTKSPGPLPDWHKPLIDIWHVDPEADGTDDSCGWSFPKLNSKQRERIKALAWQEEYEPVFTCPRVRKMMDRAEAERLLRAAIIQVASALRIKMSWNEACKIASAWSYGPDGFRSKLCFMPGWHTNFKEERKGDREDVAYGLFHSIARNLLRKRRPWWRHPRWHIWHWKIRIHWPRFNRGRLPGEAARRHKEKQPA